MIDSSCRGVLRVIAATSGWSRYRPRSFIKSSATAGLLDDRVDRYEGMDWLDNARSGAAGIDGGTPLERGTAVGQCSGGGRNPRRSAIVTRSGSESAFILRIT